MSLLVALIISEKKRQTLEANGVFSLQTNITYTFPRSVDELMSGPTPDLIISKLSDLKESTDWVDVLDNQLAHIPQAASVDSQRVVRDRWMTCEKLKQAEIDFPETFLISCESQICDVKTFPVILKTQIACGPSASHLMMIADSASDILSFFRFPKPELANGATQIDNKSIIAQTFLDHEIFLKVFVVGDNVFVFNRQVERMKSGEIFRPIVTIPDHNDHHHGQLGTTSIWFSHIQSIARRISSSFSFELFGFDVIESSNKLFVVDVNFFPTFKELVKELGGPGFRNILDSYCKNLVRNK